MFCTTLPIFLLSLSHHLILTFLIPSWSTKDHTYHYNLHKSCLYVLNFELAAYSAVNVALIGFYRR